MNNSTVEYNGTTYAFVSFGGGGTVTAKLNGKFYQFSTNECTIKLRGAA